MIIIASYKLIRSLHSEFALATIFNAPDRLLTAAQKEFSALWKEQRAKSQHLQDHLQALGIERLERQNPSDVLRAYQNSL